MLTEPTCLSLSCTWLERMRWVPRMYVDHQPYTALTALEPIGAGMWCCPAR